MGASLDRTSGTGARSVSPRDHVARLITTLGTLDDELDRIESWGLALADVLLRGGRLLACGNGGSAADAQHLTAELVGRYRDDRRPLSAIALHAETSTLTAIANDYGYDDVFARQVDAHGRAGDVLITISTSGRSPTVVEAGRVGRRRGLQVWALTGSEPNPLSQIADRVIAVAAAETATVQEVHGVLIHAMCAAIEQVVLADESATTTTTAVTDGLVRPPQGPLTGQRR